MHNEPSFNGVRFSDRRQCLVDSAGNEIRLRAQSIKVFKALAAEPGGLVSKTYLFESVWPNVQVTDDSLTKCIADIRHALSDTDHEVLKTVRKQGYMLVPDEDAIESEPGQMESSSSKPLSHRVWWVWVAVIPLLLFASVKFLSVDENATQSETRTSSIPGTPQLQLRIDEGDDKEYDTAAKVLPELKTSLSRFRTVELKTQAGEYELLLTQPDNEELINVELIRLQDNTLLLADSYSIKAPTSTEVVGVANRIAAAIASPGVGFFDRMLLQDSRLKPVEELTEAECFANGFGCAKCSGEEDNITERANACLARILEDNDQNARAWALQATIKAHQYWWGTTLPEPLRSNLNLRKHLPAEAIEAANKAESLSVGDDSAIYWGMAEAYFASCEADKLSAVVKRGLEINPSDPNLLASFGNWLSYAGRWDEGAELTRRALAIEPKHYRKWWWMGIAKTHYFKEDFQGAYDAFLNSFNDRNWVSHLQFAYTLPHLGRLDEARDSAAALKRLLPGATIEMVLEHYKVLCFPDSFLENMRTALELVDFPSRGNSDDLSDIVLPRAKTVQIDDYIAEYLDHGSGEPIVFVHGSISDYRSWGYYLVPVSERHRFISYSRRYHGTQDWPDNGEKYLLAQHTKDLINFIESLGLERVHAVSWSSGFEPLHHATIERPDLFKSVVHYEPVGVSLLSGQDIDQEQMDLWNEQWVEINSLVTEGDLELALERFVETVFESKESGGFASERESIKEVTSQNARTLAIENNEATRWATDCAVANQTSIPTLAVVGGRSNYFYRKLAEIFAECAEVAELVVIDGVNHRGPVDAVTELSDLILGFADLHANLQ